MLIVTLAFPIICLSSFCRLSIISVHPSSFSCKPTWLPFCKLFFPPIDPATFLSTQHNTVRIDTHKNCSMLIFSEVCNHMPVYWNDCSYSYTAANSDITQICLCSSNNECNPRVFQFLPSSACLLSSFQLFAYPFVSFCCYSVNFLSTHRHILKSSCRYFAVSACPITSAFSDGQIHLLIL